MRKLSIVQKTLDAVKSTEMEKFNIFGPQFHSITLKIEGLFPSLETRMNLPLATAWNLFISMQQIKKM